MLQALVIKGLFPEQGTKLLPHAQPHGQPQPHHRARICHWNSIYVDETFEFALLGLNSGRMTVGTLDGLLKSILVRGSRILPKDKACISSYT